MDLLSPNTNPNPMRQQNQANRIPQHKRIPLDEPRRLNRLKDKQWRPGRRRLRHRIDNHERQRALDRRIPQFTIHPAVQDARHRHGRVGGQEGEPEGRLGHIPDGQDDEADYVPGVGECDGPCWP